MAALRTLSLLTRAPAPRLLTRSLATANEATAEEQRITEKLKLNFDGATVAVQDVSGGCGSFYAVSIAHQSFNGLSTIKQHRIVNQVLKEDVKNWHGIQLKTSGQE